MSCGVSEWNRIVVPFRAVNRLIHPLWRWRCLVDPALMTLIVEARMATWCDAFVLTQRLAQGFFRGGELD